MNKLCYIFVFFFVLNTPVFAQAKSNQTITFGAAPTITVGGHGTVSARSTSGLATSLTSTTTGICTVSGTTVTGIKVGTCAITAKQAGNANYNAATAVTQTISIGKSNQTISFGAAPTVAVKGTGTVSARSTSGLAASLTSTTTGICTVSGTTVTGVTAGTCAITAKQAGNANYNAATAVTQSIIIGKSKQTLTFGAAPTVAVKGTGTVSARSTSGLAASLTSTTTGICTVSGTTVTGVTAGTCSITAKQAGNANYNAATAVTQSIIIGKSKQTITFGAAPTVAVKATGTVSATATSGLATSLSSTTTGICTVSGTTVTGVTAGICSITANQAGNANYNAATTVTQSIIIGKSNQTISFGVAPTIAVKGTGTVSARSTSGLATSLSSTTTGICTVSGTTITGVAAGICSITAKQAGNANYNAAMAVTQSITIGKSKQVITFGAVPTVSVKGTGTVSATATSGLAASLTSTTPGICTVSGTIVTGVTAGICSITATQAGNINYNAATAVTQSITIGKSNQTLTFGAAPTVAVKGTGTVSATSTSGLAASLTATTPGICTVSGTTITGVTAGTCAITAKQAGNANYNAATAVTQSITIGKSNQTLTFGAAPTIAVKGTGTVSAPSTSGLAASFTSTTPGICTVSGTIVTGVTAGTCAITAKQAGNANYNAATTVAQTITIGKSNQILTFGAAPTIAVKGTGTVSATATSGFAASFTSTTPGICTVSGATVTGITAGTCAITATQAGNANYNAATAVTQSITIGKSNQIITFGVAPTITVDGHGTVSATSTSGLAASLTSTTTGICTVSGTTVTGVTAGICSITAKQAGNANYNAATSVTQSITIAKSNQTLTFGAAPTIAVKGTGTVSAPSTSGLAASFTSTTTDICTVSSTTVTGVTAGTCDITATQAGNANYNAATAVTQSITIGKSNQIITFGAAPAITVDGHGTVLAPSTSGLATSLTSTTTDICTVSGTTVTGVTEGTCDITANQAGNANYNAATAVTQSFAITTAILNTPEIVLLTPSNTDAVTLAWLPVIMDVPASQVAYAVYVSTTNKFKPNATNLHHTVTGETQTVLTGLNAATTYYVLVIADNQQGAVIDGTKYMPVTTFNEPLIFNTTIPVATSAALGLGLHTQNGDTLTFNKTAGTTVPMTNSVLVSQGSDGYLLRRVDNVTVSGSQINIATSSASLSDVLDQGTVSTTMQLFDVAGVNANAPVSANTMMRSQYAALPNGNRYSQINWDNQLLTAKQTDHAYQDNQLTVTPQSIPGQLTIAMQKSAASITEEVTLKASVKFTPSLETDLRWSATGGITSGKLMARGVLSLDADTVYDFKAAGSYNPAPVVLTTKTYTSVYEVGLVPVYQEVTLTVKAKITASATAAINASTHAKATETVSVGVTYNPVTAQWEPVFNQTENKSLTAIININGGVKAEVRLIPQIEVKFYKVVAGMLTVEPYLKGDVQAAQITADRILLAALAPNLLQPTKFDMNLGWDSNVSATLTTLIRDISLLKTTKIAGTSSLLFSLPTLTLQGDTSSASNSTMKKMTLLVSNGINDNFDPNSIQWVAIPDNSTSLVPITNDGCTPNPDGYECHASFNGVASNSYHVFASGYGALGSVARQYANITVCAGSPVKIGHLEVQSCDYTSNSGYPHFIWQDAMTVAQSYGPGWHLPTKDELNVLYQNKDVVGGFASYYYWSSSQYYSGYAWLQYFSNGSQSFHGKYSTLPVRAVRAF